MSLAARIESVIEKFQPECLFGSADRLRNLISALRNALQEERVWNDFQAYEKTVRVENEAMKDLVWKETDGRMYSYRREEPKGYHYHSVPNNVKAGWSVPDADTFHLDLMIRGPFSYGHSLCGGTHMNSGNGKAWSIGTTDFVSHEALGPAVDDLRQGDVLEVTKDTFLVNYFGNNIDAGTRLIVLPDAGGRLMFHILHTVGKLETWTHIEAWIAALGSIRSGDMVMASGQLRLNGAELKARLGDVPVSLEDWSLRRHT